jgi:predicted permease
MNVITKILYFIIDVFLPITAGFMLGRHFSKKNTFFESLIKWNILTLVPLLSLLSFWVIKLETKLLWLPVLGVVMQIIPGFAGFLHARKKYESPLDRGGYIMSAMLSNRGIIGMISVFILYGEKGYAMVRLVILFAGFMLYLIYFPIARHFYSIHENTDRINQPGVKSLFNRNQAPVLGIIAGIVLNLMKVGRPHLFTVLFSAGMHISIWLYLVPIGYSIDLKQVRGHLGNMWGILPIKFIITPFVTYLAARLVGMEGPALNIVLVLSMTPTAVTALITTKVHSLNFHLAMSAYLLTTSVYLFFIFPLVFLAFETGFI